MAGFKIGKGGAAVKVAEVVSPSVVELLCEIVTLGAMVSFGTSKDGGALSVTVTWSGEWDREWFRLEEELVEWLREAVVIVSELASEPSPGKRARKPA
jgi:hypothetical protein